MSTPSLSSLSLGDLAYPATAPMSTPSEVSVPSNTPERALTPQLGRRTLPMPILDDDNVSVVTSAIDYEKVDTIVTTHQRPTSRVRPQQPRRVLLLPRLCEEPTIREVGRTAQDTPSPLHPVQHRLHVRHRISRSRHGPEHRPCVHRRKARVYHKMTAAKWNDLKRGSEQEFAVNAARTQQKIPAFMGRSTGSGARTSLARYCGRC